MILPRLLTALVAAPLFLYLIHFGGLAYSVFVVGATLVALYEYGVILTLGGKPVSRLVTILGGLSLSLAVVFNVPLGLAGVLAVGMVLLREIFASSPSFDRAAYSLFGAVFAGWMPAYLARIRDLRPSGEAMTFLFVGAVWAMDTAAYLAGSWAGRRPLSKLSPKKTWEGAAAGLAAAAAVVLGFFSATDKLSPAAAAALALAIGVGGQLSDLSESMLKRAAGVKDSGTLFPGHGGILDRMDSFILTAPVVYYCLRLGL